MLILISLSIVISYAFLDPLFSIVAISWSFCFKTSLLSNDHFFFNEI